MNSDLDEMPSLLIPTILKKAVNTFGSKTELFNKNLEQLVNLFNSTKSSHVNLHPMFMNEETWAPKTKAPMTYINIFSDDIINVAIFILKPKTKLPLHNHPEMFGLLKVIAGSVKITSFSINTEKCRKYSIEHYETEPLRIVAEKTEETLHNSDSECCILEPNARNLHEIESVDGPAAFIDILSPPYDVDIPGVGERKCSYFLLEKELEPYIFQLREIDTPNWFWSDTYPYTGPTLAT